MRGEGLEALKEAIASYAGTPRRESFIKAVDMAAERGVRRIIETGTYRGIDGDGYSTRTFARLARILGAEFISVDLSRDHIVRAAELTREDGPVKFVHADSVQYLSEFQHRIGLLYLDSYDFSADNPGPAQRHQLAETGAAFGKLADNALVLLDDCNIEHGGKGLLSGAFLLDRGFTLVHDGYQKLFAR